MNRAPSARLIATALVTAALAATVAWAPAAAGAPRAVSACMAADLSAKVTGGGAGMSQPAVYITVTNTSGQRCTVNGYPSLTGAWTKMGRQQISVTNGAVMNAPESKPRRIVLAPGGSAWFAVGAATAYDPPVVSFTRMSFTVASGAGNNTVRMSLQATAPSGKAFPLGVTAFAPGVGTSEG